MKTVAAGLQNLMTLLLICIAGSSAQCCHCLQVMQCGAILNRNCLTSCLARATALACKDGATLRKSPHMNWILCATPYTSALCLAISRRWADSSIAMTRSHVRANWIALPPTPANASTTTEHLHRYKAQTATLHISEPACMSIIWSAHGLAQHDKCGLGIASKQCWPKQYEQREQNLLVHSNSNGDNRSCILSCSGYPHLHLSAW